MYDQEVPDHDLLQPSKADRPSLPARRLWQQQRTLPRHLHVRRPQPFLRQRRHVGEMLGVDSERFLRKQAKVLLQKHDGRASQRRLSNHPQEGPSSNVPLADLRYLGGLFNEKHGECA